MMEDSKKIGEKGNFQWLKWLKFATFGLNIVEIVSEHDIVFHIDM